MRARLDAPVPSHKEWPGVALEAALTVQREDIAWLLDEVQRLREFCWLNGVGGHERYEWQHTPPEARDER